MHNYTNLKIFLWSGSGDGSNEPTETSTSEKIPFYPVNYNSKINAYRVVLITLCINYNIL